jgi:hypothetical protein
MHEININATAENMNFIEIIEIFQFQFVCLQFFSGKVFRSRENVFIREKNSNG